MAVAHCSTQATSRGGWALGMLHAKNQQGAVSGASHRSLSHALSLHVTMASFVHAYVSLFKRLERSAPSSNLSRTKPDPSQRAEDSIICPIDQVDLEHVAFCVIITPNMGDLTLSQSICHACSRLSVRTALISIARSK